MRGRQDQIYEARGPKRTISGRLGRAVTPLIIVNWIYLVNILTHHYIFIQQ